MTKNKILYNWVFHFNPYTDRWAAFKKEHILRFYKNDPSLPMFTADTVCDLEKYIVNNDIQDCENILEQALKND